MDEIWSALEASLGRLAPLALRALHGQASASSLQALASCGVADDVIASHRRHDGARVAGGVLGALPHPPEAPWTRVTRWLPAVPALEETARVEHRVAPGALVVARVGRFSVRDAIEGEPQRLVLVDASGAMFAAEAMPDDDDRLGCITLGITWRGALLALSQALADGDVVGGREDGVDRLVVRTRANSPRVSAPRRAAESLLMLLREVGALSGVVLDETQLARLDAALRKRSTAARARAVLEVLRGRDGVRPDLSEATLAALLADF